MGKGAPMSEELCDRILFALAGQLKAGRQMIYVGDYVELSFGVGPGVVGTVIDYNDNRYTVEAANVAANRLPGEVFRSVGFGELTRLSQARSNQLLEHLLRTR